MTLFMQSGSDLPDQNTVIYIMVIVGICFYFIPSIIAVLRMKKNMIAILALNFFLGWSLIGWVISLVWSLSSDSKPAKIIVNQPASSQPKEDNLDKLTKLKKLLDEGAITQDEFDQEKNRLLNKN